MANLIYYRNGKRKIVSEMSAKLAPPEMEGWAREDTAIAVPIATQRVMQKKDAPAPVQAENILPFMGKKETTAPGGVEDNETQMPDMPDTAPAVDQITEVEPTPVQKPTRARTPRAKK